MRLLKRFFPTLKTRSSHHKGFSLVELLIYMGVLMVLVGILSTLLGTIFDVQLDSSSTSAVDQDSRFIQARLGYDMQRASSITTPAIGATGSSLVLVISGNTYTYSLSGGNLQLNDAIVTSPINSSDTTVSGLTFQRIGDGDDNDTIRVNYTVTSRIQEHNGTESRAVQTTLGLQ